jgi:hypothetical protein
VNTRKLVAAQIFFTVIVYPLNVVFVSMHIYMTSTQERHTCICVHLLLHPDIVKINRLLFYLSVLVFFLLPLIFSSTLVDSGKITGAKRTQRNKRSSQPFPCAKALA